MQAKSSDVLRRWFQDVWCDGRPEAIAALFPANGLAHGLGAEPVKGPVAFRAFWDTFQATFQQIHIRVDDVVDEGERAYVRCTARMTFRDERVVLSGGCQARIVAGQIVECWSTWDFVTLLVQMGSLPADVIARAFSGERLA